MNALLLRIRLVKRANFRYIRRTLYSFFRLWLKRNKDLEKLPISGPRIIVSNHTSYVDWIILSAIYRDKYIVFLGNEDLLRRPIVSWLMKLNILIYINKEKPGYSYFREVVRKLEQGHILVIYPEGTRSKNGKMIRPKVGFVKLALVTKIPIVPVAIRNAYAILPPHRNFPRLRKCEIVVGEEIQINKDNPMFIDIFRDISNGGSISKVQMNEIAFRIMEVVRKMSGQEWDERVEWKG